MAPVPCDSSAVTDQGADRQLMSFMNTQIHRVVTLSSYSYVRVALQNYSSLQTIPLVKKKNGNQKSIEREQKRYEQ